MLDTHCIPLKCLTCWYPKMLVIVSLNVQSLFSVIDCGPPGVFYYYFIILLLSDGDIFEIVSQS